MTTNQPIIATAAPQPGVGGPLVPPGVPSPFAPQPPTPPPPGVAAPAPPPARRLVKVGFYLVCTRCQLAEEWCGCAKPPPPTQGDGVSSDLIARIREAQGGR